MSFQIKDRIFPDALPELHCHVRSVNDAFIFPKKLAVRMKEMGMTGIAITDHGVLSSIEDYRHVLQAEGLKVIPGVEMYVDNGDLGRDHAILLAVDDKGWHGISKIVTESNRHLVNGYPTLTSDLLCHVASDYRGHIIFMTACMQGVISSVFLRNSKLKKLIKKTEERRDKYAGRTSEKYIATEKALSDTDNRIEELRILRDETKRVAEQKFAQREKKISKLEGGTKEEALRLLVEDKEKAAKAASELLQIKSALSTAQKEHTKANRDFSEVLKSAAKYDELQGEIDRLNDRISDDALMSDALIVLDKYIAAFGRENVYGEIQYHGIPDEAECFPKVVEAARSRGLHLAATNDVHMLTNSKEDLVRRSIIRSMRFKTDFRMPSESDKELYLKTTAERYAALSRIFDDDTIIEAFDGIQEIYDRCDVRFETSEHYPVASQNPKKALEDLVKEGIKRRFPDGFPDEDVYQKRLVHELDTIESMGYDNYHLVVREFLNYGELLGKVPKERIPDAPVDTEELKIWIKDNDWEKNAGYRIGTGRGSDGGSLVCYLLGITNLDPIKQGLLFERFLNPERVSMPDIDSDISADSRQKVIDHCKYVYGDKAVCGIMTSTFCAPKSAINDAAKYYGFYKGEEGAYYKMGLEMAAAVPDNPGTTLATKIDTNTLNIDEEDGVPVIDYLRDKYKDDPDALEIIEWSTYMEGVFTSYGAHAAGIVITEKRSDVSDVLPLRYNTKLGFMTTQCAKDDVEANGLLKFDFLGLKTLDIITEALQMIQQRTGKCIDVLKLDTADENIYRDIFQTGNTKAVFQFESDGMRSMLKRFRPTEFSDLVLLNAAYRPGPMQFLDDIIEVKNGRKEISYLTPQLEHILKDTYGAIVYQEQVMQICRDLAGYSLGGADLVRRAMSKKKKEKLEHEREAFIYGDSERNIAGCTANGVDEKAATKIFDQMMDFASYAFNKSHAAAYAYNSYITAWLKYYYPAEFFAAALNWADNAKNDNKQGALIKEAASMGIKVLPPDINRSDTGFTVEDGKVRFSFKAIKGVGDFGSQIIKERTENGPFESFSDFLARLKPNATVIKNLILSGAFDFTGKSRTGLLDITEPLKESVKKLSEKKELIMACDTVLDNIQNCLSEGSVSEVQKKAFGKIIIKNGFDEQSLLDKKNRAFSVVYAIKKDITDRERAVQALADEDITERLLKEKDLLGAYISDTPLSGYPSNEEAGVTPVADADDTTVRLYGFIEDTKIVNRKSDGRPMAFFTITDDTASFSAICFADKYSYLKNKIRDGAVYVFTGNMLDDGKTFSIARVGTPHVSCGTVMVDVRDIRLFHVEDEKDFITRFRTDNGGFALAFYDEVTGMIRKASYRVNEEIFKSGYNVRKI